MNNKYKKCPICGMRKKLSRRINKCIENTKGIKRYHVVCDDCDLIDYMRYK